MCCWSFLLGRLCLASVDACSVCAGYGTRSRPTAPVSARWPDLMSESGSVGGHKPVYQRRLGLPIMEAAFPDAPGSSPRSRGAEAGAALPPAPGEWRRDPVEKQLTVALPPRPPVSLL